MDGITAEKNVRIVPPSKGLSEWYRQRSAIFGPLLTEARKAAGPAAAADATKEAAKADETKPAETPKEGTKKEESKSAESPKEEAKKEESKPAETPKEETKKEG
jgi:hypothetical protein